MRLIVFSGKGLDIGEECGYIGLAPIKSARQQRWDSLRLPGVCGEEEEKKMTLEDLRAFGANVDEGLNRCRGNEAFYMRLIGMVVKDSSFEKLQAALTAGDWKGAFEAAHALKGVLANLALTPIYQPASDLTEMLRAEQACDYDACLTEILAQRNKLCALCETE